MLDELCQDYEYERKYAIKLLGSNLPAPSGQTHVGREPQYGLIGAGGGGDLAGG